MLNFFGKNPWILFIISTIITIAIFIVLAEYYFIFALLMASIYYYFNYQKSLDYLCEEIHPEITFTILGELFFISMFLLMPIWTTIILLPTFEKDLDDELEYDEETYPTD